MEKYVSDLENLTLGIFSDVNYLGNTIELFGKSELFGKISELFGKLSTFKSAEDFS